MRYLTALLARTKKSSSLRATNVLQYKRSRRRLFLEQLEDRRLLATFTVINLADRGTGSLRQAIVDSNVNLGSDIIQFSSGVNGTITLTSGELAITDAVDVQGPGASVLAISGNNSSRVFYVTANATISGLTISGGNSDNGGGIYNDGTLTLEGSTLSNNSTTGSRSYGGGIFNYGVLTVDHSTVSNNTSSFQGGGIVNIGGTVSVESSTFNGNTAYDGGGINNRNGGTLTLHNSTFNGNSGSQYGGGISNDEGTLTVDHSTFSGNSSNAGGGIYNGDTATVRNRSFSGNSASGGGTGGAISNGSGIGGSLIVANSTLGERLVCSQTSG